MQIKNEEVIIDHFNALYKQIVGAKKIIYLSDNCGEIVVDNIIVDFLVTNLNKQVFLGLKGNPIANDCTLEDFRRDELTNYATEIFAVSSSFGYNIRETTSRFKELLEEADLVIAKGQSNYETTLNNFLRHPEAIFPPTFCILRTKCEVIANHLEVPLGSNVIKQMYPLSDEEKQKLTEIIDCK